MEPPRRKPNRLTNYDYSQAGYYFVTICTKDRAGLLWESDVGANIIRPLQGCPLSSIGRMVDKAIRAIPNHYPNVILDKSVVMPNHIHMILVFTGTDGRMISAPTKSLSTVIGSMKRTTSKQAGFPLWQTSFHDHIIRGESDYLCIWTYIDTNPSQWEGDIYHV